MFAEVEEFQFFAALDAVRERIEDGQEPEKAVNEVVDDVANTLYGMLSTHLRDTYEAQRFIIVTRENGPEVAGFYVLDRETGKLVGGAYETVAEVDADARHRNADNPA